MRAMVGPVLIVLAAAAQPEQATPVNLRATPEARMLFERDWVLMNWALKYFDHDHDVLLSQVEAEAAAGEFRRLADTNHDGRVSTDEYRAARALILSRY
jgi:hypothetical protein